MRAIERSIARKLYEQFSKNWRRDKRLAGAYGRPGSKPKFSDWWHMHQRKSEGMQMTTPAEVMEYMGTDPWSTGAA